MNSTPEKKNFKIFIIAGENSGDLHGSNLVRALLSHSPEAEFYGLGGEQLERAGVKLLCNIVEKLAIVGFVEVVTKYFALKRVLNSTAEFLEKERPDAVILIDYPGFNLRIARIAHELGIKVFYYIAPQVWAWAKGRVKKIAQFVDKVFVVLPFEVSFFEQEGVDVSYVGHPLLDIMNLTMTKDEVFKYFDFDPGKKLIGILPGSRKSEVKRHLDIMVQAADLIYQKRKDIQFVIPRASTIKRTLLEYDLARAEVPIKVVDQYRYNVRSAMDFAIVASGTATLETAFLGCPMVIIYKGSFLSYMIAKSLVNLPYIGLVNIVAGEMLVPELIQNEATAQNISRKVLEMLDDPEMLIAIKHEMKKIKEKMGGPGASDRAAQQMLAILRSERKSSDETTHA